jgi:hypothetical protein
MEVEGLNNTKKVLVFEPGHKPYIEEINGSLQSMRNLITGESLTANSPVVKLAFKPFKIDTFTVVYCENGIELRLKQNTHADNMVGTFFIMKQVANEIVSLTPAEVEMISVKLMETP